MSVLTHWWHRGRERCGAPHGATSVHLAKVDCVECLSLAGLVPAESKESSMAKQQQNATQLEIKVPIDKQILEHRRNRLIEVEQKIDKVKSKKREVSAEYSVKLKELGEERKELLDQIETGFQPLTVQVYERPDQRLHRMLKVRTDTGEVVGERALTSTEQQVTLDEVLASKDAADQVAEKANGKSNGHAKPAKAKAPKAAKPKKGERKSREEIEQTEGGLV